MALDDVPLCAESLVKEGIAEDVSRKVAKTRSDIDPTRSGVVAKI
jgi:hypothetical protein